LRQFKLYFSVLLLLASHLAQADDDFNWWASMELGAAYMQNTDQTVVQATSVPHRPNIYVTDNVEDTAVLGVGLGYTFELADDDDFFPSNRLGVYYDYYVPTNVSGHIENDHAVVGYIYTLQARSHSLWLNDQFDLFNWNDIIPFIEGGIGVSFNSIYDYKETPVLANLPAGHSRSAGFESNSDTSFAWRAGAGVNVVLPRGLKPFTLGLLYRYSDRGDINTGPSETYPTVNKSLGTPLKSNDVLLSLTYSGFYDD